MPRPFLGKDPGVGGCGSAELRRGVCMPDGVDVPLVLRLDGAGLADPEGVRVLTPFVRNPLPIAEPPTAKRDGRGVVVLLVGVRTGNREPSLSVLSSDNEEPCRLGGFEPARLTGREFGFELPRDAPGVKPVRVCSDVLRGVVYLPPTPKLLSLSLSESGVEAECDDRVGRDMATDRCERSRTQCTEGWQCGAWGLRGDDLVPRIKIDPPAPI